MKDSYSLIYNLLLVATPRPITVVSKPSDNKETFPAGTEVGFKYNSKSLLGVDVAGAVLITLYDKDGNKVGGPYDVALSVLKLGLLEFNDGVEAVVKAPVPFSSAKIELTGLKVLKVGAETVNYAFVRMAPSLASHHCKINAPLTRNVAAYEKEFTLQSNPNIPVKWKVEERPEGSNITLDATTGKVSNISVPGDYKFTVEVTSKDNCKFLAEGKGSSKEKGREKSCRRHDAAREQRGRTGKIPAERQVRRRPVKYYRKGCEERFSRAHIGIVRFHLSHSKHLACQEQWYRGHQVGRRIEPRQERKRKEYEGRSRGVYEAKRTECRCA